MNTAKIAVRDPQNANLCILPDGRRLNAGNAMHLDGYTIVHTEAEAELLRAAHAPRLTERQALQLEILDTPEAKAHPWAAKAILSSDITDLGTVRTLLRGMPSEHDNQDFDPMASSYSDAELTHAVKAHLATLRERAENHGDSAAAQEVGAINYAMRVYHTQSISFGEALTQVGLDARKTSESILAHMPEAAPVDAKKAARLAEISGAMRAFNTSRGYKR